MEDILYNYLIHTCGKENVSRDVSLSTKTTFQIGGAAKYFVVAPNKEALLKLQSALNFLGQPYYIIGMGANILASSTGYDGVVIQLGFKDITHTDEFIYADAGAKLGVVGNYAREHGLSGLEWSTGIPATIGGAVYMNCGAFNKEMKDIVIMADVLQKNGEVVTLPNSQMEFGYRDSIFHRVPMIILGAYLRMDKGNKEEIALGMKEVMAKRSNHPKEPSAGSVFKRPQDGFYVGKEIEKLGFKGYQIGGAKVAESHANFIINDGGASSGDVLAVMKEIKEKVKAATGVELQSEIEFLGFKE
jgi:UDP-N-acetylmuramate dehydrogenase